MTVGEKRFSALEVEFTYPIMESPLPSSSLSSNDKKKPPVVRGKRKECCLFEKVIVKEEVNHCLLEDEIWIRTNREDVYAHARVRTISIFCKNIYVFVIQYICVY